MREQSSTADRDDHILAEFVAAVEKQGSAAVADYLARYPYLAAQIHDFVRVHDAIEDSRPDVENTAPAQLGDCRIIRTMARGGMGEIYEAMQDRLHRRVVVKTIRRGRLSPEARDRFLREQRVLAGLHQTHIVPIHTAGEEGNLQYFVMPFIDGAALHHVVRVARDLESTQPGSKTPSLARLAGLANSGNAAADIPTRDLPAGRDDVQPAKLRLSRDYFRSVAEVVADAADAIQHAHDAGILHRDVKPSNIMLDKSGACWIIDFGLAGYVNGASEANSGRLTPGLGPELITSTGILGTPQYMAPEQWRKEKVDCRSDVWGLGVTLYELLTLHRPFDGESPEAVERRVLDAAPAPPRTLVANLPRDLEAICRKAMHKNPAHRYTTAAAFATDLRRWLRMEPTIARPTRTPRRMYLWARRNPGWAAALSLLLTVAGTRVWAALEESAVLEARARRAEESLLAKAKELALQVPHKNNWSNEVMKYVADATKGDNNLSMRNQAVACLQGLDVRLEKRFDFSASSVAFHSDGKQLLMGGTDGTDRKGLQSARLWDGTVNPPLESKLSGDGPVSFTAHAAPLQLVIKDDKTLLLWNVASQTAVREFPLPIAKWPGESRVQFGFALAANGALVATSGRFIHAEDRTKAWELTRVWEVKSGKVVRSVDQFAPAMAFSPDGNMLATSDQDGFITICSLPGDKQVARLYRDRAVAMALAFGRDPRRKAPRSDAGWLLAAGDDSGTVTIWDVENASIRALCRGSQYHIHALAFSPDGMTLASAGREHARLWDIATGAPLLDIRENNWMTGVAFSPDGQRLAVSSATTFQRAGRVAVWALDHGRGIKSLRGLSAEVERVIFSPDDRLVAALAHDSRIGVWDVKENRLLHVFEAPRTEWVDNATIGFSPDSKQLVFAGSSSAGGGHIKLWSIQDGTENVEWKVPYGLHNKLAYHEEKGLIFFQMERKGAKRAGTVYSLVSGKPARPLHTIAEFDRHIDFPQLSGDGKLLVMVGYFSEGKAVKRRIKVFDAITGKDLFASAPETTERAAALMIQLDRPGRTLGVTYRNEKAFVLEMPTGRFLEPSEQTRERQDWSPDWPFQVGHTLAGFPDLSPVLYPSASKNPVLVLGIDLPPSGTQMSFDSVGHRLAWGQSDGTVNVADFGEIERRLTEVGLGW